MGLMAIYANLLLWVRIQLKPRGRLDSVTGGILSLGTFFMLQVPVETL